MKTEQKTCYYAVRYGRRPGVYTTWEECKKQIQGYPGASVSMCTTIEEAQAYLANFPDLVAEIPSPLNSLPATEDYTIYVEGLKSGYYGVFWGDKHIRNSSGSFKTGTISRQRAIVHAINHAIHQSLDDDGLIRIVFNSRYVLQAMKKLNLWVSNGWKQSNGSELKNRDVYERTLNLLLLKKGHVSFMDGADKIFKEHIQQAKHLASIGCEEK
ncbi:hypothetical protein BD770DRAFT_470763 [Pilaira anomala]|nr:hypothetical protein BD770DRAFT_470763 [Pilaira anomala]